MWRCVARDIRKAPRRCTPRTTSQSSAVILKSRLSRVTPALLISTVGAPSSSATRATAVATASSSATSAPTPRALPPAETIASTVAPQAAASRSSTATANPSLASLLATAAPMPRAAPVTIAVLFSPLTTSSILAPPSWVHQVPGPSCHRRRPRRRADQMCEEHSRDPLLGRGVQQPRPRGRDSRRFQGSRSGTHRWVRHPTSLGPRVRCPHPHASRARVDRRRGHVGSAAGHVITHAPSLPRSPQFARRKRSALRNGAAHGRGCWNRRGGRAAGQESPPPPRAKVLAKTRWSVTVRSQR